MTEYRISDEEKKVFYNFELGQRWWRQRMSHLQKKVFSAIQLDPARRLYSLPPQDRRSHWTSSRQRIIIYFPWWLFLPGLYSLFSGLYYKRITIVNDDSRVISK